MLAAVGLRMIQCNPGINIFHSVMMNGLRPGEYHLVGCQGQLKCKSEFCSGATGAAISTLAIMEEKKQEGGGGDSD